MRVDLQSRTGIFVNACEIVGNSCQKSPAREGIPRATPPATIPQKDGLARRTQLGARHLGGPTMRLRLGKVSPRRVPSAPAGSVSKRRLEEYKAARPVLSRPQRLPEEEEGEEDEKTTTTGG